MLFMAFLSVLLLLPSYHAVLLLLPPCTLKWLIAVTIVVFVT